MLPASDIEIKVRRHEVLRDRNENRLTGRKTCTKVFLMNIAAPSTKPGRI